MTPNHEGPEPGYELVGEGGQQVGDLGVELAEDDANKGLVSGATRKATTSSAIPRR